VAFAPGEQAWAQLPQFCGELEVDVSQPFDALPSQLPYPVLHWSTWHTDATHFDVAFAREHGLLQNPQWATDMVVSISQPLLLSPSQSAVPAGQLETPQMPPLHTAVAPCDGQTVPHALQCWGSTFRFASHPSAATPLQSANPALHDTIEQAPEEQAGTALASKQELPHVPQFVSDPSTSVSHPSAASPLQLAHRGSHWPIEHVPPRHTAWACGSWQLQPHWFWVPPPPHVSGVLQSPH
jgi:hypothetical protein